MIGDRSTNDCLAIIERFSPGDSLAVRRGIASDCIFCQARLNAAPPSGARIMLLNGYNAGREGIVVSEWSAGLHHAEFDCSMEDTGHTQIINPDLNLFSLVPPVPPPVWFPPLSLRDAFVIDEITLWFLDRCRLSPGPFDWSDVGFDEVIRTCWEKRIPILPSEIASVLVAHGMPRRYARKSEHAYEAGFRLLVWSVGKAPMKNRRLVKLRKSEKPFWFSAPRKA